LCCWPHDPRWVFRARRYRSDWQSLVEAYRDAYTLANEQPESYQRMSEAAVMRMRDFCSKQRIYEKLQRFLRESAVLSRAALEQTSLVGRPLAAAASLPREKGGRDRFGSEGRELQNMKLLD